jgi:hypothetical protein
MSDLQREAGELTRGDLDGPAAAALDVETAFLDDVTAKRVRPILGLVDTLA